MHSTDFIGLDNYSLRAQNWRKKKWVPPLLAGVVLYVPFGDITYVYVRECVYVFLVFR